MDAYSLQLLNNVIRPTLEHIGIGNVETKAWLLLGTATIATASLTAPSWPEHYGIYAIKSEDHVRVWDEFLAKDPDMASAVRGLASQHRFLQQPDAELNTNLAYATAIAAMVYEEATAAWSTTTAPASLAYLWAQSFWPHEEREASEFIRLIVPLQQGCVFANAA